MRNDCSKEHVFGCGGFVTSHHWTDHISASHGNDGKLLVTEGLVFRRDFCFAVFELALPTLNVGLNATSLALAKVVEFEEGAVLFRRG